MALPHPFPLTSQLFRVPSVVTMRTRLQQAALALSLFATAGLMVSGLSPVASAQTAVTGALTGTVTDASGAVVAGAQVVVTDPSTNSKVTVVTNAEGRYTVGLLKPSVYKITVTSAGLKSDTLQATVVVGATATGDVKVTPTGDTTVIDVNATTVPLLDTQNITLATTFTESQIQLLPTPGGDVTTVAFTAPGVVVNSGGEYGNFSSDGLPGISNLFVLNGFDNQDPFLNLNNSGSSNLSLGQGELQEATVIQNAYNSQYGRAAGAIISYTTKSGTNRFHGMADYNYNGTVLNANGWINSFAGQERPHAVSNEWAANVGGPIIKDKVFFFADYEGLRYVLPASGYFTTPSAALETYTQNNITAEAIGPDALAFANQQFAIYNAAATKYGASNVTAANSSKLGCGDLAGTPTGDGGTFGVDTPCVQEGFGNANNINKEWLFTGRGDWVVSPKHKLYGRYKMDRGSQPTSTSYINPLFDAVSIQPEYEGQFNDSYEFSANKANVFVAAANWYSAYFGPQNVSAAQAVYPFYSYTDYGVDGSGSNESGGLTPLGVPYYLTQGRNVTQYQLEDDFLWIKGKNTFRFGGNFRRDLVSDYDSQEETIFPFSLVYDLPDFTQGQVGPSNEFYGNNYYQQAYTAFPTAHLALYNLGVYVQDELQVSPKLKLTMGVRIDRTGNPLAHNGAFSLYNSGTFAAGTADDPYSSAVGGPLNPNNDHPFPSVEVLNFQPRFGFNYAIDEKTEIRGGAGLFSDLYPAGFVDGVLTNYPNYNAATITTGVLAATGPNNVVSNAATANATAQSQFTSGGSLNSTNAALQALGVSSAPPTIGAYFPSKFRVPEYVEYSLQLQRMLTPKDAISITYAGNYGYNEVLTNPFVNPSSGFFNSADGAWESTGAPMIAGIGYTPTNADFGKITAYTNNGHSNYSGLQINYKHSGHGITGQLSYTWSHTLDMVSNAGTGELWNAGAVSNQVTPSLGPGNLNYSNADYDIRHNVSGDIVYEEPFKFHHIIMDSVLGGWIVSAKTFWRTGEPFSIESNQSGDYGQLGSVLMGQTAGNVKASQLTNLSAKSSHLCVFNAECLNGNQFYGGSNSNQPTYGLQTTFGNLRRNSLFGPHYMDTDMALSKKIYHREAMALTIGANAYNVFNKANFAAPDGVEGDSTFGEITSTVAPPTSPYGSFQGAAVTQRVLQVHGKFTF
jgi:hypothetical protein